ncbi:MAG: DUF296 domain-containing protein [Candidatus Thermoplasmatota archaeon]|nr:DUF296 domain-containing protein [Candidatus Thermoplasmatota archaeon]
MDHNRSGNTIVARMFPGEDYLLCLGELCISANAMAVVVISSIGQLRNVELGYFVGPSDYSPEMFEGPCELLSVSGSIIVQDNIPIPHLHAVLGNRDKSVIGGHLISGKVEITNETVLEIIDVPVSRRLDLSTGLMDLVP